MFASILMMALLGQCGPSGCSVRPSSSIPQPSFVLQPSSYPISAPIRSPMKKFWTKHNGMDVFVEATLTERGTITWNPESEWNRSSIQIAEAKRGQPQTKPQPAPQNVGSLVPNYGLEPGRGLAAHNGPAATAYIEQAKAIEAPSERLHLTVIGPQPERDKLAGDLKTNPALAPLKDAIYFQGYDPGDWAVDRSLGFPARGLLLQDRAGKVLYRANEYTAETANQLNTAACEALRRPKPNYDPSLDPGPATGRTGSCPLGFTWSITLVLAAAVAAIYYLPSKEPVS